MIVQGQDFITPSSEVAAVVVDKKPYQDPMDAFYKADNYYNQWKVAKDREKALKQAQLATELKDYSFDDKGADPTHADSFISDKKRIAQGTAELLGMKRDSPEYMQKALALKSETEQLRTAASASAEWLKIKNAQIKELYDHVDKYDDVKTKKALAERSTLPRDEQLRLASTPFLVPKTKPFAEYVRNDLYKKDNPYTQPIKYSEPTKDGHIVTGEKFTPEMGLSAMGKFLIPNTKEYDSAMYDYDEAQKNPMYAGLIAQAKDPKINPNYPPLVYFAHHAYAPDAINGVTKYEMTDEAKANLDIKTEGSKAYAKKTGEGKATSDQLMDLSRDRMDLLSGVGQYWIKDNVDPNKKYLAIKPNNISNNPQSPVGVIQVEVIKNNGQLQYKYRTTESNDSKGKSSANTGLTYDANGYVINGDGSPITDPTFIEDIYPLANQEIKPAIRNNIDKFKEASGGSFYNYNEKRGGELKYEPVKKSVSTKQQKKEEKGFFDKIFGGAKEENKVVGKKDNNL